MADISYTRTTWADGQEGGTAIDATKLNNIEQGIVDAVAAIGPNDTTEDGTLKAQIDENTSDIEALQESVSRFTFTDVSEIEFFGDSYCFQVRASVGNDKCAISFVRDHKEIEFFVNDVKIWSFA